MSAPRGLEWESKRALSLRALRSKARQSPQILGNSGINDSNDINESNGNSGINETNGINENNDRVLVIRLRLGCRTSIGQCLWLLGLAASMVYCCMVWDKN